MKLRLLRVHFLLVLSQLGLAQATLFDSKSGSFARKPSRRAFRPAGEFLMRRTREICISLATLALMGTASVQSRADAILGFTDIQAGTLTVFNPYQGQGFNLTSSSGGFAFNSPDTGNGSHQTVGNNPFYAGANGLVSFSPATITLTQTNGNPFSLLLIDLARSFAFDSAPSVTFTGTLAGGDTVVESFTVTTPAGTPGSFQTFDFTGFTDIVSVSWEQGASGQGIHQFSNIHLGTGIPEPSTLLLAALGIPLLMASRIRARHLGG